MLAVVSDSSPFVYLTRLGRFELLRQLYDQVMIPPAVWREVALEGADRLEAANVRQAVADGWLRIEAVATSGADTDSALLRLGDGEREAILLAREKHAMLIIDESDGREVATRLGVRCTGTIGVLMEAKLRGLIPEIRRELATLRQETNFRFTEEVLAEALRKAGETQA